jgi:AAA+ ATPase superfamily predicted ATPase
MVINTDIIIGRKGEIETVREHIRRRNSLHIHGPEGVGKSALIVHVYRTWDEIGTSLIPIYCTNSGTFREILVTIAESLLRHGVRLISIDKYKRAQLISRSADLKTLSTRYLRNMVFPRIKSGNFCIILDHLEDVTPRINSFLTALHECSSIITASRRSWDVSNHTSVSGSLAYDLWLIPKLRVGNLDKKDAFTLIKSLYRTLNMNVANEIHLFKDIYDVSQGNPKMIKNIFKKAADPKYLQDGRFNLDLIVIDCRMDEVQMP